jgi:hypothetical protein
MVGLSYIIGCRGTKRFYLFVGGLAVRAISTLNGAKHYLIALTFFRIMFYVMARMPSGMATLEVNIISD